MDGYNDCANTYIGTVKQMIKTTFISPITPTHVPTKTNKY